MDNYFFNRFQKLTDVPLPDGLHVATYRAMILHRYKKYTVIIASLISLTFLFSVWHVYTRMIEAEALSTIKILISASELTLDSIFDSTKTLFEFLPIQSIILSLLNFITLAFMFFLFQTFNKLEKRLEVK